MTATSATAPTPNKTWANAAITITPTATNEVGQPHTFTVTVLNDTGSGLLPVGAGEQCNVTLTNGNGAVATPAGPFNLTTNASGQCAVTFTSATAGTVTGHASSMLSVGGINFTIQTDGTSPNSGDAVKTFVDANIAITPANANNPVGTNHVLTLHVNVNPGTGFVNAPAGTSITASIQSGPGSFVGSPTCTTVGTTGSCTVTITSSTTGTTVVRGTTTVSVGGLSLTRTTGDSHVGDSADANKNWVNAGITITPSATNEVGQPHTFTVTASRRTRAGTGFVPVGADEQCKVTLTDSNGAVATPAGPINLHDQRQRPVQRHLHLGHGGHR